MVPAFQRENYGKREKEKLYLRATHQQLSQSSQGQDISTESGWWLFFSSHSAVSDSETPWTAACQVSLFSTVSWSLLRLVSFWVCDAIQPSYPLSPFSSCSQAFPAWRSFLMSWLFASGGQRSISPSSEYSGFISLTIDWFDLFAVQGTLKSLLQHQCSKASILWCSACFMVQISHLYMATGKTIALTMQTFIGEVMSLLFNMLSRFVIAFIPRGKCLLLISWLQSLSAVILEPRKITSVTISIFFPIYLPWSCGTRCHDLSFLNAEF